MRERGIFVTVDRPQRGPFVMPGRPVKMSNSSAEVEAAPLLGADKAALCGEWLGLSPQGLAALKAAQVI
ncbi:MAG: hypothetical protein IRZ09_05770 [Variibacter sp.]|nr:hypothetical protein [Variibacter sp.]